MSTGTEMLADLAKLTREEFQEFCKSGAFSGFLAEDMAHANELDRGKMELFNEMIRLTATAKRLQRRKGL
jgi:hypothetical protein